MSTIDVDLPKDIFDVQVNIPLIHQVVVAQQAAARQGTHDTKTRAEVAGGGRKPYRQKGTGRARQGSIRAPQFAGGGVVHGPTPRSYDQRTPKKMKAAALRGALSDRARAGRIHVVDSLISGDAPSTKGALAALLAITGRRRPLVVTERADKLTTLSLRNVADLHLIALDQLNTYDVLLSDDVVFTKAAYDAFVAARSTGEAGSIKLSAYAVESAPGPEKAPATKTAPFGPGSEAPLKSGNAPKGHDILGNADSKKYHTPDSQWYDQTEAEVWFDTVESAEAAGFSAPGGDAK